tara:strand:+ start:4184 stop:4897 length:714 start_codon:yes stop_codon:yes gene_type:complete
MVSLGGLDVAYGANTQITRTTVLAVATDATTTQAQADIVHTIANDKFPAALRPDYTCFLGADKAVGYATALTHQVENGILKDMSAVPVAGARFQATAASSNRMPNIEAILSVGAVELDNADTANQDTLFDEDTTSGMQITELTTGASIQSQLMASQFALTAADSGQSAPVAGNAGVQTLDYTQILDDTEFNGATEIATGALSSLTVDSTASALLDAFGAAGTSAGFLYSVVALTTLR